MKRKSFQPKALTALAAAALVCGAAHAQLAVTSTAFANGGAIPDPFTYTLAGQCSGANETPPLEIANIPTGTQTLAIRVVDTSAGDFVHWKVWDIPVSSGQTTVTLAQNSGPAAGGVTTNNDFGANGYGGPCPPQGTGAHNYEFRIYALTAAAGGPEPADAALDGLGANDKGVLTGTRTYGVSVPMPGGGAGPAVAAVPTLSEMGVTFMGLMLVGVAAARLRRRRL